MNKLLTAVIVSAFTLAAAPSFAASHAAAAPAASGAKAKAEKTEKAAAKPKAAKDGAFSTQMMIAVDISVPLGGMSGEHGALKALTPNPEALTYVQADQCIEHTRLPFAVERHGQRKLARQPAREAPTEEEPRET